MMLLYNIFKTGLIQISPIIIFYNNFYPIIYKKFESITKLNIYVII